MAVLIIEFARRPINPRTFRDCPIPKPIIPIRTNGTNILILFPFERYEL